MERRGEDPPSDEDIAYFGFYQACKNTRGEFSIFGDGLAARGRFGTSPLFWNRQTALFSFEEGDGDLEEFPEGYLYDVAKDRLVCWEPMYYDKPLGMTIDEAVFTLRNLLKDAIEFRIDKCDAFLLSKDAGSILVDSFLEPGTIDTYTAFSSMEPGFYYDDVQKRTIIFVEGGEDIMGSLSTKFLKNKTVLSGLGCDELFSGDDDMFVKSKSIVEHFSDRVYSPFLDSHVVEYVMDMTKPDTRPRILTKLIYGKN